MAGVESGANATLGHVWENYCGSDSWNLLTKGLHNGDLYMVLSLLSYFRAADPRSARVRLIVDTPGKFEICALFPTVFDDSFLVTEIYDIHYDDILDWSRANKRFGFAPGCLVTLHPLHYIRPHIRLESLIFNRGYLNLADMLKVVLRTPLNVALSPPVVSEAQRERAKALLASHGLPEERTIVIFPYGTTFPFDSGPLLAPLVRLAQDEGYAVCSAVHGREQPLAGTTALTVPFDLMIPFCELAGAAVSVRSGISDILSSARCRKVTLYDDHGVERFDSPNAYGACDDSVPFVCDPANPEGQADIIFERLLGARFREGPDFLPRVVWDYLRVSRPAHGAVAFNTRTGVKMGRHTVCRNAVLTEGWSELEPDGVWSIGFRAIAYLALPEELAVSGEPVDLHLRLGVSLTATRLTQQVRFECNGRSCELDLKERSVRITVRLSQAEIAVRYHRVIFDIRTPRPPDDRESRLLGVKFVSFEYRKSDLVSGDDRIWLPIEAR